MKVFEKCGIFRRENWIIQGNVIVLLPCRCMSDAVEMGWMGLHTIFKSRHISTRNASCIFEFGDIVGLPRPKQRIAGGSEEMTLQAPFNISKNGPEVRKESGL